MKSYSIGREESCNIVIDDSMKLVSRRHATINVDGRKITIVDNSTNGTYINGIRISSGIPVPVTRKDVVSFAQVKELDWKTIPDESKKTAWIIAAVAVAVIAAGLGTYFILTKDKKQEEVRVEEQKVAWTQSGEKIESMKKAVASIADDYKAVSDTLKALMASLESKDVSDKKSASKAESIKKNFWQIEDAVGKVDAEGLQKSLDSVVQSYEDKVSSTPDRIAELEKRIAEGRESLDKALKNVKEASEAIASLKTKVRAQPQKDAGKEEEQKEVIIVGM